MDPSKLLAVVSDMGYHSPLVIEEAIVELMDKIGLDQFDEVNDKVKFRKILENCDREICVTDISESVENIKIPVEVHDVLPSRFKYIDENFTHKQFEHGFTLIDAACLCKGGDCFDRKKDFCSCAMDEGQFCYYRDGVLSKEFMTKALQGEKSRDVERVFIKECNIKCCCSLNCSNRVVQRGITRKLEVFKDLKTKKGWGLRSMEELPAGAFVAEFIGELMTSMELDDLYASAPEIKRKGKKLELDRYYGMYLDASIKDQPLALDARYYGNVARFINHRCHDANLMDIPVMIESTEKLYYHVAFFTKCEVKCHEELTWDYGMAFDQPGDFICECGSKYCRDRRSKVYKKRVQKMFL